MQGTEALLRTKVPQVTLAFWIIKIAATTLGETGGDAVTMSMKLGYGVGTAIFAVLFVVAVSAQIAATRYRPFLFWTVIVATTSRHSSAPAKIGKAISTSRLVTSVFQVKIGIRNIVMPGARMQMIVVMKLTAPRMVPSPAIHRPITHRSPPTPGE